MLRCVFLLAWPPLIVAAAIGCNTGKAAPKLHPITGTVILNGKPLPGADVTFIPLGDTVGIRSAGRTSPDGTYELLCQRGKEKGAVEGQFKVTISRRLMPDGSPVPEDDKTPPIESPARESLPAIYSDQFKTVLKTTVPSSGPVDFKIQAKGIKGY